MAKDDLLRKALAEQELELESLDTQLAVLQPLQQRRANVFQLVGQIRFMLGMEPYKSPERPMPLTNRPDNQKAIWEVAKLVLEQTQQPMNAGDLTNVLRGLGFPQLVGRAGKETVRAVLAKKTNVFERQSAGAKILRYARRAQRRLSEKPRTRRAARVRPN